MPESKVRPLTKHENLLRLLFEHADEILEKLGVLSDSAQKFERLEILINGLDGTPGLIEVVEALTYEINRVEGRAGRSSDLGVIQMDILSRFNRVEALLEVCLSTNSESQIGQQNSLTLIHRLTAFMCFLGAINLFLLASGAIASHI